MDKILALRSGGSVVISLERVNLFAVDDVERQLLTEIGDAVRKYERNLLATRVAPVAAGERQGEG